MIVSTYTFHANPLIRSSHYSVHLSGRTAEEICTEAFLQKDGNGKLRDRVQHNFACNWLSSGLLRRVVVIELDV
jgi:hypothetical protein